MFRVTIATDNAAFHGNDAAEVETARILRDLADDLKSRGVDDYIGGRPLADSNGNTVGMAEYIET